MNINEIYTAVSRGTRLQDITVIGEPSLYEREFPEPDYECTVLKVPATVHQHYIYLMERSDGKLIYVGETNNVRRRFKEHLKESDFQVRKGIKWTIKTIAITYAWKSDRIDAIDNKRKVERYYISKYGLMYPGKLLNKGDVSADVREKQKTAFKQLEEAVMRCFEIKENRDDIRLKISPEVVGITGIDAVGIPRETKRRFGKRTTKAAVMVEIEALREIIKKQLMAKYRMIDYSDPEYDWALPSENGEYNELAELADLAELAEEADDFDPEWM
jgi:predicted GIY-YIG superfamily endonuclease